ncbi:hypothetical protein D3C78_928890 [compost metagenome]
MDRVRIAASCASDRLRVTWASAASRSRRAWFISPWTKKLRPHRASKKGRGRGPCARLRRPRVLYTRSRTRTGRPDLSRATPARVHSIIAWKLRLGGGSIRGSSSSRAPVVSSRLSRYIPRSRCSSIAVSGLPASGSASMERRVSSKRSIRLQVNSAQPTARSRSICRHQASRGKASASCSSWAKCASPISSRAARVSSCTLPARSLAAWAWRMASTYRP